MYILRIPMHWKFTLIFCFTFLSPPLLIMCNEIAFQTDGDKVLLTLAPRFPLCLDYGIPLESVIALINKDPASDGCSLLEAVSSDDDLIIGADFMISVKRPIYLYDQSFVTRIYCTLTCSNKDEVVEREFELEILHQSLTGQKKKKIKRNAALSNAITFDKSIYVANVTEEGSADQPVLTVRAINPDYMPVFYNLIATQDVRSGQFFVINRNNGQIRTVRPLDRETMQRHAFRVTAFEGAGGNPSRSATASVLIDVVDINDHVPVFEKSVYVSSVSETAEIGATVLHVHARDEDADAYGDVRYDVIKGDVNRTFEIDPITGVLKIRRQLDREFNDFYRLNVRACDRTPTTATSTVEEPKCSQALVEITVEDENDNAPQFVESKFEVDVPENKDFLKKPVIAKIAATDSDSGDNGEIRYSIVSGNVANRFSVDHRTGDVRLLEKLNHKQTALYELVVRAQDSGSASMSNTTTLIINVLDVNDNAPRFYTSQFQETVREDVPVGYNVVRLQAYDADNGANADIRYSLMPSTDEGHKRRMPLSVDPVSGWVSVAKPLDRENDSLFDFYVLATDRGSPPLSSSVRVIVSVSDVNDNAPTFDHKFYNVSVWETAPRGTEVTRIKAYDLDQASTRLDYSISAGNEEHTFVLLNQGDSGLLTVNDKLDYKIRSVYTITVKAIDSGGYYDTALVYIYVVDVNSPPYFVRDRFQISVAENVPVNSTVDIVQATDNDDGFNSLITYSLDGGQDYFYIDNKTGLILVNKTLDREITPKYNLRIIARDNGKPTMMASTELEIVVDDVNDNAPQFQYYNYSTSISEDTAVGTSFMSVTATDYDSGANGRIAYSFGHDSTANDSFYIDATSGTIRVNKPLDRELQSDYFLTVLAVDKGSPSLTGSTNVHVALTDINDNPPKFDSESYSFYIRENRPVGTRVARLLAVDPDAPGANSAVTYKIFGGPDTAMFELTALGDGRGAEIRTRTELDYEASKNVYNFQVQASSGDLSSVAEIQIRVEDVNDHAPVLEDFFLIFNNYPDYFPSAPPGLIPAYDPDVNDTLMYWIDAGNEANLLSIDSDSGQLFLSSNLNTNRQVDAQMRICVSDGANKVCATCTLRVVLITEEVLLNSITLRAKDVTVHAFLNPNTYTRFVDAAATLLPSNRHDIIVFSVRHDGIFHGESVLNISLSIRRPNGEQFVSAGELQELVHLNRELISNMAHLDLLPFADNLCVREPCLNFERCQNVLRFGEATNFVTTKNFLFRPIHPVNTFVCACPDGFAGMSKQYMCDTEINLCYSSPCGPNATCVSKEGGYVCQCPPNFTGQKCEFSLLTDFCLPGLCGGTSRCALGSGSLKCHGCQYQPEFSTNFCQLKSRTFDKSSYVTFPPLSQRYRFDLKLSFATTANEGVLFYNGRYHPEDDFISLLLEEGKLKLLISIGGSIGGDYHPDDIARLTLPDGMTFNDGRWHSIKINYFNRTITMSTEECDEVVALLKHRNELNFAKCAVQTTISLDNRCSDPTVSCYRFLDLSGPFYVGGLPEGNRAQQFRVKSPSFNGCIQNLHIDNELIDFGRFVVDRNTKAGCSNLQDKCSTVRPCEHFKRCVNVWNGYVCECVDGYGGKNCTEKIAPALRLSSDESYVTYHVPQTFPVPFAFGITVKTRQHTTTLLTAEFHGRRQVGFKLLNKRLSVAYGNDLLNLTYPADLADARWHALSVTVIDNRLLVDIDYLYTATFVLSETFFGGLSKIYVGSAVGGNFRQPYFGCIKGAFLSRSIENLQELRVENQYRTEIGCHVTDPCQSNPCPKHSVCVQDWDSYLCKCLPGYVGDTCTEVCSLKPCKNRGVCRRTLTGYECQCSERFTGSHCQHLQPTTGQQCPKNWWGHPLCGPCKCDTGKGYDADCNKTNGQCYCEALRYKDENSNACLPCNCYYPQGSASLACNAKTGQCPCKADAQGRRCNRCSNPKAEINNKTGRCEIVEDTCPESFAVETVWRRSGFETNSVQSCPDGTTGLATRYCSKQNLWLEPKLFNCTSKRYDHLNNLLVQVDSNLEFSPYLAKRTALQLKNASAESLPLYGRDLYISYRLLMMLLRNELSNDRTAQFNHLQDKRFVENLIVASSVILDGENAHWWQEITDDVQDASGHFVQTLHEYGKLVSQSLQTTFVKPFRVDTKNIVYAVDTLVTSSSQRIILPKFDNFLFPKGAPVDDVSIELPASAKNEPNSVAVVFYAIYKSVSVLMSSNSLNNRNGRTKFVINSAVLSVLLFNNSNSLIKTTRTEPFLLCFALYNFSNALNAHCVWWEQSLNSKGAWKTDGCQLFWRNDTHVICSCTHLSTLAVMTEVGNNAFVETVDTVLPYYSILCVTLTFALLLICLCIQCFPNGIRHSNSQSIFKSIAICFMIVALTYVFIIRAQQIEIACKFVDFALEYFYLALFLWILLAPVHLYRIITEIKDVESSSCWVYCIVGWGIPLLVTAGSAIVNYHIGGNENYCWLAFDSAIIWIMFAPVGLVILLTLYMCGLCAIIGYSKEWDVLSTKLNFRSQLFTVVLTEFACIMVWLLAVVSVNFQRLDLHYCYHTSMLITAGIIAYLVCHEGSKFNKNVKKAYLWITKAMPDEMTMSKSVGGVSGEDPSATVSRPDSPVLSACNRQYCAEMYQTEEELDEDVNETTALSSFSQKAVVGSGYLDQGLPDPSSMFVDNDARLRTIRKGSDYEYSRPSKPDVIPSWEQQHNAVAVPSARQAADMTSTTYVPYGAARYGSSYRRPIYSSNSLNRGILSPVQKVLSDSESNPEHALCGRQSPSSSATTLVTFSSSPRRMVPKYDVDDAAGGCSTNTLILNNCDRQASRALPQKCFTSEELSSFNQRGSTNAINNRTISRDSVI